MWWLPLIRFNSHPLVSKKTETFRQSRFGHKLIQRWLKWHQNNWYILDHKVKITFETSNSVMASQPKVPSSSRPQFEKPSLMLRMVKIKER